MKWALRTGGRCAGARGGLFQPLSKELFFFLGKFERDFFLWLCLTVCGIFIPRPGPRLEACAHCSGSVGSLALGPRGGPALCFNHLLSALLLAGTVMGAGTHFDTSVNLDTGVHGSFQIMFFLDICPGVGWQGAMRALFFVFWYLKTVPHSTIARFLILIYFLSSPSAIFAIVILSYLLCKFTVMG